MTAITTLIIDMAANVARLQSDMNQAKTAVGGAMNDITGFATKAKNALGLIGVAVSAGAFAALIKDSINAAARLDDLAKVTGISAAQLSALERVGITTGTTADKLAGMLTKLGKNMIDVNEPSSKAGASLKALGINTKEFLDLKPDEQLLAIAKAQAKFADGGEKAAAMEALLGKGAAEAVPYLYDLADAQELSAVWSDEQAEAADNLNDTIDAVKAGSTDWVRVLTGGMLPALAAGAKAFWATWSEASGLRDGLKKLVEDGTIDRWTRGAITGLTYVMDALSYLKRTFEIVGQAILNGFYAISSVITGIGEAFRRMIAGDFSGAVSAMKSGISGAHQIMADFGNLAKDVWGEKTFGQMMRDRLADTKAFTNAAEEVKPALDVRGILDENAAAAKGQNEKLEDIVVTAKKIKEAELENLTVYRRKIELSDEAKAAIKAEQEELTKYNKMQEEVLGSLSDALFEAFENGKNFLDAFVDTLINTFKTLVLRPTIEAIVRPVSAGISGILAPVGKAFATGMKGGATGGGGGIMGSIGSMAGTVGSMFGAFGSGAAYGLGAWAGGATSALGTFIGGGSAALGAAAPVIAAVYAIYKGLSRGPKVVTETGISGQIVGGDATAQMYEKWKQKGGWIVGDRKGTRYKSLGEELAASLDTAAAGVYGQMSEWSRAVGLPAEKLAEVMHSITIKMGKTDEETQANIDAAITGYQEALAAKFADVLEPFRQAGDTLVETLQRLVAVQQASEALNQFGGMFSRIAALSIDAREELIGFAGGIEALIQKAQSFVGSYYSAEEQAAIGARSIATSLKGIGIDPALLTSKSDFRSLFESQDVSTTEGRQMVAALLDIAPAFAQIAEQLGGGTLADLAAKAPQLQVLTSIFDQGAEAADLAQQTVEGVDRLNEGVTAAGDAIVGAITEMKNEVVSAVVAVAASTAATARQLERWDDNGSLTTTVLP